MVGFFITQSSSLSPLRYWLEDIDLNGKSTWHGPVIPVVSHEPLPKKVKPELLSELGMRMSKRYEHYWRVQELKERIKQRPMKRFRPSTHSVEQAFKALNPENLRVKSIKSGQPSELNRIMQQFLASQPAVKLSVNKEGWYRVSQPELVAAGLNPGVNPRYLQLFVDGREQPIRVMGEKDGRFDLQDTIEFYGVGLDTPSTDTQVYWLMVGPKYGERIQVSKGRGGQAATSSFPYTVENRERIIYFAALKNGDEDNFFGPIVTTNPVDQILNVRHPDTAPPADALLEVALQGVTNEPNRVKVLLNDIESGDVAFEGQSRGVEKSAVPQSLLLDGENLVTLIAQNGVMDVSLVDCIRLTYWHTYTADDDALRFTASGRKQVLIEGFSSPLIRVVDITNPQEIQEATGTVNPQGSGFAITLKVLGSGNHTLYAFVEDKAKKPVKMKANQPSTWYHGSNRADFAIISHSDFLESLRPLKDLRESQGWSVALIDVEDIYDGFSYGNKNPQAIKDFLRYAKAKWNKPPRYVLLVGDATFDLRNYLGFGDLDLVPTRLVGTKYLETASDDWFSDFDGDGVPEMAVGRLPVQTAEETTTVVSKIIGYEHSGPMMEALLVADKNDGFAFEAASEEVGYFLPANITVTDIFRGQTNNGTAREQLLSRLNGGPLLVNYIGHGSVEIWRGNLITSDDANSLINGSRLPLVVAMTCLNGMFHDLYTESLAEALLKAEQGGAVAVWASSGLTEPDGQAVLNKELIQLLFNGGSITLGEAAMKAKEAVSDRDIRRTWILFGDPTIRLKSGLRTED